MAAVDLIGQAEHGPGSPAILLTNRRSSPGRRLLRLEKLLSWLPTAMIARQAWQNCGEIILCDTLDEMVQEADRIASEHVQVLTRRSGLFPTAPDNLAHCFSGIAQRGVMETSD